MPKSKRPAAKRKKAPARRRNPADARDLAQAKRLSRRFHGTDTEVIELSAKERKLPKFLVALGETETLDYSPRSGSKRGNTKWVHASGDRGQGKLAAKAKPVLAVDPKTKRPVLIPMKSPMKLSSKRGLVG